MVHGVTRELTPQRTAILREIHERVGFVTTFDEAVPMENRDPKRRFGGPKLTDTDGRPIVPCEVCDRKMARVRDHAFPWALGGATVEANRLLLCKKCDFVKKFVNGSPYGNLPPEWRRELDRLREEWVPPNPMMMRLAHTGMTELRRITHRLQNALASDPIGDDRSTSSK